MRDPDQAAHLLGKLLKHFGDDNVLWGTDSIWYGSPQDQIQAFRAFEISGEFQQRYGYPALTHERKTKILGLNAARVYGIEPAAMRRKLKRDKVQKSRLDYLNDPIRRSKPTGRARGANGSRCASGRAASRDARRELGLPCCSQERAAPAVRGVVLPSVETTSRGSSCHTTYPQSADDPHLRRPQALAGADRPVPGRPDDRARHDDRERRAAVDPRRPAVHRDLAGLGGQRLPADLRRLPAARRAAGRPLRPSAAVPARHRAVHAGVAGLRAGHLAGAADRRARGAGPGRRGGLGGRAVADHEAVHRAGRARQGDGRLRLRLRRRRQRRRAARRPADQRAQLALDLPGQPADRRRGVRAVPRAAAR